MKRDKTKIKRCCINLLVFVTLTVWAASCAPAASAAPGDPKGLTIHLTVRDKNGVDVTYKGKTAADAVASNPTVAEVEPGSTIILSLVLENNDTVSYGYGSTVFLPVPKAGKAYDHYFNNVDNVDPAAMENDSASRKTPQFSLSLLGGPISYPADWEVYYTTSSVYTTNAGAKDKSWRPVGPNVYTWTDYYGAPFWTTSPSSWADVTMIRLTSTKSDLYPGYNHYSAPIQFRLKVDEGASPGELDFWRAYVKSMVGTAYVAPPGGFNETFAWENGGTGVWTYGEIAAAKIRPAPTTTSTTTTTTTTTTAPATTTTTTTTVPATATTTTTAPATTTAATTTTTVPATTMATTITTTVPTTPTVTAAPYSTDFTVPTTTAAPELLPKTGGGNGEAEYLFVLCGFAVFAAAILLHSKKHDKKFCAKIHIS
ncbi:MAG: hypothetical protein FWF05_00995 [Oscillospiraceae bacterium]|nr:hypothetical protein [Oscillospiraceae bacterium]